MMVIPAIDVLNGEVVRLQRGVFAERTTYASDPAVQLAAWSDEGAELVHVVDLDGARHGRPARQLWESLAAEDVPFQLGGGIRTAEIAVDAVGYGATRVVVGTVAVADPGALDEMLDAVGAERLVAAIDVREGRAMGGGWLEEGPPATEVAQRLQAQGLRRILVTSIAADGMMTGPDLEVLATVASTVPELALIASGGVGSVDDLRSLRETGSEAVVVGRALYEARFTLGEAIAAAA